MLASGRRQRVFTSAIRGPPPNLGSVADTHPGRNVLWFTMPLMENGPYGSDCVSAGDFTVNGTQYHHFAHLFNILATVAEDTEEGGWIIKESTSNKRNWAAIVTAIAKKEMGEGDQALDAFLATRAFKGRYFDSNVNAAVKAAKAQLRKERDKKKRRHDITDEERSMQTLSVCARITFSHIDGAVAPVAPNPRGMRPNYYRTWKTAEDLERLAAAADERDTARQDMEETPAVTGEDLLDAAAAIEEESCGIMPKWEVVAYALPASDPNGANREAVAPRPVRMDEVGRLATDFLQDTRNTHFFDDTRTGDSNGPRFVEESNGDATRDALLQAINIDRKSRVAGGREIAAILWAFIQYDDLNPGKTISRMIDHVDFRDQYMGPRRQVGKDAYVDPFQRLAPYIGREHAVHIITQASLWRWIRLYSGLKFDRTQERDALTFWQPGHMKGPLHPNNWATLKNAIRAAGKCGVDTRVFSAASFISGMQERMDNGASSREAQRGADGFTRLKIPTEKRRILDPTSGPARYRNVEVPACKAWAWLDDAFWQIGQNRATGAGIFETTFPFIRSITDTPIEDEGDSMDDDDEGSRSNSLARSGILPTRIEDMSPEQREEFEARLEEINPDGMLTRELAIEEYWRLHGMSDWEKVVTRVAQSGAPYGTNNVMVDNYYRKKRLELVTGKSFVHPDDGEDAMERYHKEWVPAMKRHTAVTAAWFQDSLRYNASTNKFCKAVTMALDKFKANGMKTLTSTQYLFDNGRFNDAGEWEPGLDPFAHQIINYIRMLRQNKGVEDPLMVWFASKAVSSCYDFRPGRALPLIVISAPAGEGKTYVLTVLQYLAITGTTRQENHVSDMVSTAGEDVDAAIMTDEAKGILQKAKTASTSSVELSKSMTAGTGTIASARAEYDINPMTGKRELTVAETEYVHSKAWVVGTNNKEEEVVPEMAARTIWFNKPKAFLPASALSWESFKEWARDTQEWNHVQQIARFHIYKGVQNGAIPAFHNMPVVNMIFTWMTHNLRERGIEPMEGRHENRTHEKIKGFIIDDVVNNAIAYAIHTPGGPCYNDEVDTNLWLRIAPMLYPTLQVILWNIRALGHLWLSSHINHVLVAMLKVCGYQWVKGKTAAQVCYEDADATISWRMRRARADNTDKDNNNNDNGDENGDNNGRARGSQARPTWDCDLNYVTADDSPAFWNAVSQEMPEKHRQAPSWIRMMITNTATKQMFRPANGMYVHLPLQAIQDMKAANSTGMFHPYTAIDDTGRLPTHNSVPVVEMSAYTHGKRRKIYIATAAPDILGGDELITAFLTSVISGKFTPRSFLLPNTHPKYRDVLDKFVITKERVESIVRQMDTAIEAQYKQEFPNWDVDPNDPLGASRGARSDNEDVVPMNLDGESEDDEVGIFHGADSSEDDEAVIEQPTLAAKFAGKLTGHWETDKYLLCRKYGVSMMDESHFSKVDEMMLLKRGHEYNAILDKDWEKYAEAILRKRQKNITQITMDFDEYSARERWIKCGLPLRDKDGAPVPIPTPQNIMERYNKYMETHTPENFETFDYPKDEIEDRERREKPRTILRRVNLNTIDLGSFTSHGTVANANRSDSRARERNARDMVRQRSELLRSQSRDNVQSMGGFSSSLPVGL